MQDNLTAIRQSRIARSLSEECFARSLYHLEAVLDRQCNPEFHRLRAYQLFNEAMAWAILAQNVIMANKAPTPEQAAEYVLKHLNDLAYEDVKIIKVIAREEMNTKFQKVIFTMRQQDGADSNWQHDFDVWLQEDGTIYGEW